MCQFSYLWIWRQEIKINRFFPKMDRPGDVDHKIYLVSPNSVDQIVSETFAVSPVFVLYVDIKN